MQEYWSGLPFPSPMHESEKWKWSHSAVSNSSWPHRLQPTRLLCPWDFPGKSSGVGCHLPSPIWKHKRSQIAKAVLRKGNGAGGINLPDFRLYYKAIAIKTVWCWHKNRNIDQQNKLESPEINPHTYGYVSFDKGGKNIQWGRDNLFNKLCWENWTATCKRMKLEHFLMPYTKISSKWIKDLNVRPDTIKLLEENVGKTLDINQSKIFCDPPPRVMGIKAKNKKNFN